MGRHHVDRLPVDGYGVSVASPLGLQTPQVHQCRHLGLLVLPRVLEAGHVEAGAAPEHALGLLTPPSACQQLAKVQVRHCNIRR